MTPARTEPPSPEPGRLSGEELRRRLDFDDAQLLAECRVELLRVSGPGGQHRNKVATAVRLLHRPSGLFVTGTERRSQRENKANAVRRLREALAVYTRAPLSERITWPASVRIVTGRLRISEKNPALHHVLGLVLDALFACGGRTQDAARRLGLTATSLTRFLAAHPKAWAEANRIRKEAGLPPLRA